MPYRVTAGQLGSVLLETERFNDAVDFARSQGPLAGPFYVYSVDIFGLMSQKAIVFGD
jgi:hypothetical protein